MIKTTLILFWLSIATSSATSIRPWLGLTISDWAFVVGLCFSLSDLMPILLTSLRRSHPVYYLGAVMIVIASLMSGWSVMMPQDIYLYTSKIAFAFLVFIPALGWAISDRTVLEKFQNAWIYSGALAGFCAIVQYLNGGVLLGVESIYGRMTGLAEHPNELGLLTAVVLPQALQKMIAARGSGGFLLNLVLSGFIAAGILLSVSMTGLVCGGVGVTCLLALSISRKRLRKKIILTILALSLMAVIFGLSMGDTIDGLIERIQYTRSGDKQTTVDTRILGVREIVLDGGGIEVLGKGVYAVVDADGNAVHNIYLRAGVELGLFGILGLILVTASVLLVAVQKVRNAQEIDYEFNAGLLVSYLVFLVGGQASPILAQRNLWVPAMFILAPELQGPALPSRLPNRSRYTRRRQATLE